jgi:DNA-binding PadR family transcriptional regulator
MEGRSINSDIISIIEHRIINSFMDFIVLFALRGNGGYISGYDAVKYVYRRFKFLPSSGTVYAHLYAMERDGLLKGVQNGRCRVYCLTQKGVDFLREIERANGSIKRLLGMIFPFKNGAGEDWDGEGADGFGRTP